jgi:hypothetical protein
VLIVELPPVDDVEFPVPAELPVELFPPVPFVTVVLEPPPVELAPAPASFPKHSGLVHSTVVVEVLPQPIDITQNIDDMCLFI